MENNIIKKEIDNSTSKFKHPIELYALNFHFHTESEHSFIELANENEEQFAVKYLSEQSVNEMLSEKDAEIERLKSEVPKWISADIEPHCYESGNWDGKRSDWHLVETKEGLSVGRCYSGFMDGSSFCCWYSDKDYEIEVIRYQKINQY